MYKGKTVSVYLPCRNESAHLKEIVGRTPSFVDEIIIVSNKSSDNTYEKALELGVKALKDDRVKNGIGYGFAHMTGLEAAAGEIVATADGDGTYPIEHLDKVIDHLLEKNLDFISCNRYPLQTGTRIPFKLQLGVKLLNWEVHLLYGLGIKDILSGMWIVRKEKKDLLNLTEGDWNLSPQVKLNAARHPEMKFSEFSIVQHGRLGETKQNYWKTGFNHMWWIFRNRLMEIIFSIRKWRILPFLPQN